MSPESMTQEPMKDKYEALKVWEIKDCLKVWEIEDLLVCAKEHIIIYSEYQKIS